MENGSWTQSQEVVWLSGLVEYGSSTDDFTIASAPEKYANSAALCEPVRATAFFWHTENDSPIQLYPGEQQHVSVDGSREVTIENNAPSDAPSWGVPPTAYSCEGSARALYVGWGAIDEGDIPPTVSVTGGSGTLYASHFQQASDRAVDGSLSCYGADPNSNYYWPTPDYSYSYPTPDYSFDWDRLAR